MKLIPNFRPRQLIKKPFLLILSMSYITLLSCSPKTLVNTENGKQVDKRLVGTWQGSEDDNQMEGLSKTWTMIREADGHFTLTFQMDMNGEQDETTEEGTWWVKDNLFYERHTASGETDIYSYEVIDKNTIQFTAEELAFPQENHDYQFIDKRVEE